MFTIITPKTVYRVNGHGKSAEQVATLAESVGMTVLSVLKDGSRFKGARGA